MSKIIVAILKLYQVILSPFLPAACRFYPTCSHYMVDAIRHKGMVKGVLSGLIRIGKCHPFHEGGYDPVIIDGEENE